MAQHWERRGANLSENEDVRSEYKKSGEKSRQMAPVSTICDEYTRHKYLNTCVIFPFPNVDLGITVVSLVQNSRQMAPVSTICDEYCRCINRK